MFHNGRPETSTYTRTKRWTLNLYLDNTENEATLKQQHRTNETAEEPGGIQPTTENQHALALGQNVQAEEPPPKPEAPKPAGKPVLETVLKTD
jgi:hypothetical protein